MRLEVMEWGDLTCVSKAPFDLRGHVGNGLLVTRTTWATELIDSESTWATGDLIT